jgi:hypothetical protein
MKEVVMNKLITTAAIAAALSSTGCFTLVGLTIGAVSDGPPPLKRPRPPDPAQLRNLPPGSYYFSQTHATPRAQQDTGMSGAAKGALAGVVVDAAVIALLAVAISRIDLDFGCHEGC